MSGQLFDILRQWRNQKALHEGKQPFMIFNNATVRATAEANPQKVEDLNDIKGWGPRKIEKYGEEVIDLLTQNGHEHQQAAETEQPMMMPPKKEEDDALSVDQCIHLLNRHLNELVTLKVRGEINDVSRRQRYAFFNLKDTSGEYTLPCFIGWQNFDRYAHIIDEGVEVLIAGSPSIYKNGRLSLDIKRIEPVGKGALQRAFEKLKTELETQGYFDAEKKRPMPKNPRKIGLITSEHGAAIRDFRENLKPYGFAIHFAHVYVEGDYAVNSISSAIDAMNIHHPDLDVLIIMRGGGGLENLKAFNSLEIAQAIARSRIPTLTGIGHETDLSIADLCADHYVSTPTATASFLNQQKQQLEQQFKNLSMRLLNFTQELLSSQNNTLALLQDSLTRQTERLVQSQQHTIRQLGAQLQHQLAKIFSSFEQLKFSFLQRSNALHRKIESYHSSMTLFDEKLKLLNPKNVLKKGYAIVTHKKEAMSSAQQVRSLTEFSIEFHDGSVDAKLIKE
jgi:exodeoxyribonuclease VII large subunit